MDVTDGRNSEREVFDDLVGAYALDAVEPDEARMLDDYITRDRGAAREAERLREAASWLGAIGALEPPTSLRSRLLTAAADRPALLSPAEVFTAETRRLSELLEALSPEDAETLTHNGLTVSDLVAHLNVVDDAFAQELRAPNREWLNADEVARITEAELPELANVPFLNRVARWQHGCRELLDAAAHTTQERAGGYAADDILLIRSFEAWTHIGDIRAATGRAPESPAPAVLHTMADLSVRSLPAALSLTGNAQPGRTARLVLTGAGGGEGMVPMAYGETAGPVADVEVRVPVVDWCLRFADRLDASAVDYAAEGDRALAAAAIEAAPAFAGL
jgi:uncharacterized protein (TIGR03083 family)